MRIEHERLMIKELADEILEEGLRVFISSKGTYGFFTDQKGSRVVSFQINYSSISFSGNYNTNKPQSTGTGWAIGDGAVSDYQQLLHTPIPDWAVSGATVVNFRTLEQHLKMYNSSSNYTELLKEAANE